MSTAAGARPRTLTGASPVPIGKRLGLVAPQNSASKAVGNHGWLRLKLPNGQNSQSSSVTYAAFSVVCWNVVEGPRRSATGTLKS